MKTTRKAYPIPPPGRLSRSLNEVCGLTGFGMTSVRQAIDAELLPAHRLGKRVILKRADVDEFLRKLPRGFAKKKSEGSAAKM